MGAGKEMHGLAGRGAAGDTGKLPVGIAGESAGALRIEAGQAPCCFGIPNEKASRVLIRSRHGS